MTLTDAERLERRRASWRKYRRSAKGKASQKTYEDKLQRARNTPQGADSLERLAKMCEE